MNYQNIRVLLTNNEYQKVFEQLNIIFNGDKSTLNALTLLSSRYNDWHKREMILGISEDKTELNQIRFAILELLKMLEFKGDEFEIEELIESSSGFKEILLKHNNDETIRAMEEIKKIMSEFIPELKELSEKFQEKAFRQIRDENIFNINSRRVFVFGKTNAGKTTTINSLLNADVFPTSMELGCTQSIACGKHAGGLIFYDSPGVGDMDKEENITRAALGITQMEDDQTIKIKLIDYSGNKNEGPEDFNVLSYEDIKKDINEGFYKNNQSKIVAKEFEVEKFKLWAQKNFDFFVFILPIGNGNGLDGQQLRFLKKFYSTWGKQAKIFKVMNIWNDKKHSNFKHSISDLHSDTQDVINQAIKRLKDENLPDPDKWYLVESNFGNGFQSLVQGFADTLPLEDLVRIEQVIKSDYTYLIQKRIDDLYFDYITKVASVVSVYPIDYTVEGHNLFSYSVNSIFIVAEYVYGSKKEFPSEFVDQIINNTRSARLDYTTRIIKKKKKKYRSLRSGFAPIDFLVHDLLGVEDKEVYYEKKKKKVKDWFYQIGGQVSIEVILAIGIAVIKTYRLSRGSKSISTHFQEQYAKNIAKFSPQISILDIPESLRYMSEERTKYSTKIQETLKGITID